jgi:GTP:adenosylcobinamide-phosphate guanylyltransferase
MGREQRAELGVATRGAGDPGDPLSMYAIVTAGGGSNPKDPLYPVAQGMSKALLNVGGKPMVQWVLESLEGSKHIQAVVIVGLSETAGLSCSKPLYHLSDQGTLLRNILHGAQFVMERDPLTRRVLSISSDIPGITASMLEWIIDRSLSSDDHFYYCVIDRSVMEARFPGCRRTFVRFRDREVCGGDLAIMSTEVFSSAMGVWDRLLHSRKHKLQQAALIGYDVLLLLLLRRLTIEEAARRAGKRLGIRGRAIYCPFAEVGMDVDKPFQMEIMDRYLRERARGGV